MPTNGDSAPRPDFDKPARGRSLPPSRPCSNAPSQWRRRSHPGWSANNIPLDHPAARSSPGSTVAFTRYRQRHEFAGGRGPGWQACAAAYLGARGRRPQRARRPLSWSARPRPPTFAQCGAVLLFRERRAASGRPDPCAPVRRRLRGRRFDDGAIWRRRLG